MKNISPCCCGSGSQYARCCGPWHDGQAAPNAEALMRSRYGAYVLRLPAYLMATWHPSTRPARLDLADGHTTRWLGLDVKRHEQTGPHTAIVEFVARYRIGGGSAQRLHEISRFVREAGCWYYVDGEFPGE